tara:strand:- start:97644 stop:99689 length:2046 start_codon:yes stop_codon:yes gene_type:complete
MPITTILYITLAAIFALGFVFFAYFYKSKHKTRNTYFLAIFRFVSIFTLLLLIINPKVQKAELELVKPDLILAIDGSSSIKELKKEDSVRLFAKALLNNEKLQEQFNISEYIFADEIELKGTEEIIFNKTRTNIYNALNSLKKLNSTKPTALLLISDGNTTYGQDYEYFKLKENTALFPILVGDTTSYLDISVSALNVNRYAFLNNKFPVEVILNYTGKIPVQANFEIRSGNTIIFKQSVQFSKEKTSAIITTNLTANQIGTKIYEAKISSSEIEKNTFNNSRKFAVEVIDEKTNILLISDISHPDLGALKKAIEKNEQRHVEIASVNEYSKLDISDYQLLIVYQPNNKFNKAFEDIQDNKMNYFIITGGKTDWNFLNSSQKYFNQDITGQTQDLFPVYNDNYLQFQFEDIGFNKFPPLENYFGKLNITSENSNVLLYQKVEGIITALPLLTIFQDNEIKTGVLFGENIWKWRAETFRTTESFEAFDDFIGKYIQYLSSTKKRNRLTVELEPFYLENESISITSQYFDKNYVFNPEAILNIYINKSESNFKLEAQMLPQTNFYSAVFKDLKAGDYNFTVKEEGSGIERNGKFSVLEFNVEQQFSSANFQKMDFLASNNSSKVYMLSEQSLLIAKLLEENQFLPVQKIHEKSVPLINWKFLLILLVLSLSAEWFTRKYFGLI